MRWLLHDVRITVSHHTNIQVGSHNNVITIQQADFEAFAALDMDSATTNMKHKRGGETEFGQEIPAMSSFESKPGPPILPPHLLQVSGIWYLLSGI